MIALGGLLSGIPVWQVGGLILGLCIYMFDKIERKLNALLDDKEIRVD